MYKSNLYSHICSRLLTLYSLAVIKENSSVTLEAGEKTVEYSKDRIRFRLTSF